MSAISSDEFQVASSLKFNLDALDTESGGEAAPVVVENVKGYDTTESFLRRDPQTVLGSKSVSDLRSSFLMLICYRSD